jgi:hypothetical protein
MARNAENVLLVPFDCENTDFVPISFSVMEFCRKIWKRWVSLGESSEGKCQALRTWKLTLAAMKKVQMYVTAQRLIFSSEDGFGGLVLASGFRVRGFKPGRSRWIFLYI